ncbi:MAG TPA: hypothetical protein VMH40_19240 [Myxococcaceae bacterium]|nr:hypothetical protein [Myxococcaceae bacterium]
MTSRGVKTGLGLLALLLPGGLLLLIGWVLVRALARATARIRSDASFPAEGGHLRDLVGRLSFRDVLREARAAL